MSIKHRTRASAGILKTAALLTCAAGISAAVPAICSAAVLNARAARVQAPIQLAQFDSGDQPDVAPQDVQKYVNVYRAMQANHRLTVKEAAAKQGLTVEQFRSLEDRIMRNDALRAQVRKELRTAAKPSQAK